MTTERQIAGHPCCGRTFTVPTASAFTVTCEDCRRSWRWTHQPGRYEVIETHEAQR